MAASPDDTRNIKKRSLTPRHGELTGFPRKIKDAMADVHNLIQKWEKLKNIGLNVLSDLANLKISKRRNEELSCYPVGIEDLCFKLRNDCDSLLAISRKLSLIAVQMKRILEATTNGSSPDVYFLSWPVGQFAQITKEIADMYKSEADAKLLIVESVAHIDFLPGGGLRDPEDSRDILMTYVASWLHEPYINEDARDLLLKELLLETGHAQ